MHERERGEGREADERTKKGRVERQDLARAAMLGPWWQQQEEETAETTTVPIETRQQNWVENQQHLLLPRRKTWPPAGESGRESRE